MNQLGTLKKQVFFIVAMEVVVLALLVALSMFDYAMGMAIVLVVNIILVLWVFSKTSNNEDKNVQVSAYVGDVPSEALDFGKVGIVSYNAQYEITSVSDFLKTRNFNHVGQKVTMFSKQIEELFQGLIDIVVCEYDGYNYEIVKQPGEPTLMVRDTTRSKALKVNYEKDALVVGMIHMDNYSDMQAFEDESVMSLINVTLRQPIVDWARQNDVVIRRLRSDRFYLILNEERYRTIEQNKFDLLTQTRSQANLIDASITLSMAFARGHIDLTTLDDMANDLLELAQSRGGDQVAMKRYGGDVQYFGGRSEGTSGRSRVRVRVMAQSMKELIKESNAVFLSGHKDMDFDCMAANLAMSRLVQFYGKKAYIVSNSGGIEGHVNQAMNYYEDHLKDRHTFISDEEACKLRKKNDLLMVLDYSNPQLSGAPKLLERMEKTVIVDHHRRGDNFIQNSILVYIESSASSTCELISELIAYQPGKVNVSDSEATMMYLGILIDTNRFKMRTGFRTFEACAQLKKWGVEPVEAENLLRVTYEEFESKTNILKFAKLFQDTIMISCVENDTILARSLLSIGADAMLEVQQIEASFVIARISKDEVAISARSKGNINVQVLMEKMQGGGHFSAAALQRKNSTTSNLCVELKQILEDYKHEEEN